MADDLNLRFLDATTPRSTGGGLNQDGTESGDLIRGEDIRNGIKTPVNTALIAIQQTVNAINREIGIDEDSLARIRTGFRPEEADVSGGTIVFTPAAGTIRQNDSFFVATGGRAFGLTEPLVANDLIVAIVGNPSLNTSVTTDWRVFRSGDTHGFLTLDDRALLNQFSRSGNIFTASDRVLVDEDNVVQFRQNAVGTPFNTNIIVNRESSSTQFTVTGVRFLGIDSSGGTMVLSLDWTLAEFGGFQHTFSTLVMDFDGNRFVFPATGFSTFNTSLVLRADVPPADYSSAVNVDPIVTLNSSGVNGYMRGTIQITSLFIDATGPLHDSVLDLATTEANRAIDASNAADARTRGTGTDQYLTLRDLEDRVSPLRTKLISEADGENSYFLDSSGSDDFPTSLASFSRVDPNHADHQVQSTAVFVAVPSDENYEFENVTTDFSFSLTPETASTASFLERGAAIRGAGGVFEVYRVTGIGVGHTVRTIHDNVLNIPAREDDVAELTRAVRYLRGIVDRLTPIKLDEQLASVFENQVTFREEVNANRFPADLNVTLSQDGTQSVFPEQGRVAAAGTSQPTSQIRNATSSRRGRKLIYLPMTSADQGSVLVAENPDGTDVQELILREGDNLVLRRFLESHGSATRSVIRYPEPSDGISGPGTYFTIINHSQVFEPQSGRLRFVRQLPSTAAVLTVFTQVVGVGSGFLSSEQILVVNDVGGTEEISNDESYFLPNGGLINIEATWRPAYNDVVIDATVTARGSGAFIFDTLVRLEWTETVRGASSREASTRFVTIAPWLPNAVEPVMIGPSNGVRVASDNSRLVIATRFGIWDTQFSFNDLFGNTDTGRLSIEQGGTPQPVEIYDYEKLNLSQDACVTLYGALTRPERGIFRKSFTTDSLVTVDVPLVSPRSHEETTEAIRNVLDQDFGKILIYDRMQAASLTITSQTIGNYRDKFWMEILRKGPGALAVRAADGVTLNGIDDGGTLIDGQYSRVRLDRLSSDEWVITGDHGNVQ